MKFLKKLWGMIIGRKTKVSPILDDDSVIMAKPYVDAPSHALCLDTLDRKKRK